MMLTKADCRWQVRALLEENRQRLPELSVAALKALRTNANFVAARRVLLFHSLPDEVCTHRFLQEIAETKQVFLPIVQGRKMWVTEFRSNDALRQGAFRIQEPQGEPYAGMIDAAVVPGVAFDNAGHRLGRGKGYYDKFLATNDCYKIGLCFSFQRLPSIPSEAHDVLMDEVVSD